MNRQDARAAVEQAIGGIAPDVDLQELEEAARLRQDLDLDSLDFLRLVETIAESTGVDIPERDYGQVSTVGQLIAYLEARALQ